MEEYFTTIRCLSNNGLNPKIKLNNVHVYEEDLLEVFGTKVQLQANNPTSSRWKKIGFEEASLANLWCTYSNQQWLYVMVNEVVHLV